MSPKKNRFRAGCRKCNASKFSIRNVLKTISTICMSVMIMMIQNWNTSTL